MSEKKIEEMDDRELAEKLYHDVELLGQLIPKLTELQVEFSRKLTAVGKGMRELEERVEKLEQVKLEIYTGRKH